MEQKKVSGNAKVIERAALLSIALGIWILVLQNLGIIPTTQNVHIKGGVITDIENDVNIRGKVKVGNTVDINIEKINGYDNVFYNNPSSGDEDKYYRIPVTAR